MVKNLPTNVGNLGLIPGLGRSPGQGNGNLLHYSCLGNPMDRGPWWATVHGSAKESDMTEWLNENNICQSYLSKTGKKKMWNRKENTWSTSWLCQLSFGIEANWWIVIRYESILSVTFLRNGPQDWAVEEQNYSEKVKQFHLPQSDSSSSLFWENGMIVKQKFTIRSMC